MRLPTGHQRPNLETNATRFSYRSAKGFAEVIASEFRPFPKPPYPPTDHKVGVLS